MPFFHFGWTLTTGTGECKCYACAADDPAPAPPQNIDDPPPPPQDPGTGQNGEPVARAGTSAAPMQSTDSADPVSTIESSRGSEVEPEPRNHNCHNISASNQKPCETLDFSSLPGNRGSNGISPPSMKLDRNSVNDVTSKSSAPSMFSISYLNPEMLNKGLANKKNPITDIMNATPEGSGTATKRPRGLLGDIVESPTQLKKQRLTMPVLSVSRTINSVHPTPCQDNENRDDVAIDMSSRPEQEPGPETFQQNPNNKVVGLPSATFSAGDFKISDPSISIHPSLRAINDQIKMTGSYNVMNLVIRHKDHGYVQFLGYRNLNCLGPGADISKLVRFSHGSVEVDDALQQEPMMVTLKNITRKDFANQRGKETVTDDELNEIVTALKVLTRACYSYYMEQEAIWTFLLCSNQNEDNGIH